MKKKQKEAETKWVALGDIAPNEHVDVGVSFKPDKIVILKNSILEAIAMEDINKGDFVTVKYVKSKNEFQAKKCKPPTR